MLGNTTAEIKIHQKGLNSRSEPAEERVSELEEVAPPEEQNSSKRQKHTEPRRPGDTTACTTVCTTEVPESTFEEITSEQPQGW